MLKLRPLSSLLVVSGIVAAGLACSSGGTEPTTSVKLDPTAGTGSGGSGTSAGTGSVVPAAGTTAMTGGSDSGQAGSQAAAGTGGMVGPSGGTGGGSSGGTGGGSSGGTGGGASGGTGGGTGGTGEEGKVMLAFADWYPRNSGPNSPNPWTNNGDGTMTVKSGGGDILSKMAFSNVFLHVEYRTPKIDVSPMDPQQRGNSGVYLKGSYEMQVLDTFGFPVQNDYCGALYKIAAPLLSACKMAGEWNSYDIEFQANVCTNGQKTTNAKFPLVKLNDMTVLQNAVADHTTQAGLDETCMPRGVMLQDHGTVVPVSFRNIWAIPRP